MSSLARTLEGELKGVLQEKAEKDQLRFIGPLSVALQLIRSSHQASSKLGRSFAKGSVKSCLLKKSPTWTPRSFAGSRFSEGA